MNQNRDIEGTNQSGREQRPDKTKKELEEKGPPSPHVIPANTAKEALKGLKLVANIQILSRGQQSVDSQELIRVDTSPALLSFAMHQFRKLIVTNPSSTADVFNNLGCAYALLEWYKEAEEALQNALKPTTPDKNGAKDAARHNLKIVSDISQDN